MSKLIIAYRKCPTAANRAKLQNYLNKHPFVLCMADDEELLFLKLNGFEV